MSNWKKLGGRNRSAQHNTVRAPQATVDQLNVTKNLGQGGTTKIGSNLTIDGSSGYVNFGLIDGSNGYGFRNDDGSMQFRNPDLSNWVDFTHAGHIAAGTLWRQGSGNDIYNKLQTGPVGRVGINIETPLTELDISGSARIYDGSYGYLNFGPNVSALNPALGYGIRNLNGTMQFRDFSSVGSTSWQDFCGNVGGSGNYWLPGIDAGEIFYDSGNVGIGDINNPGTLLDIYISDVDSGEQLRIKNNAYDGSAGILLQSGSGQSAAFRAVSSVPNVNTLRITNPVNSGMSGDFFLDARGSGNIIFTTTDSNTERMTITNAGDVSCNKDVMVDGSFILGSDWNFRSDATGDLDISAINNGDCILIKTRPGESIQTNANLVFNDRDNFTPAWWELQGNSTNFLLYPKNPPSTQFVDISAKIITCWAEDVMVDGSFILGSDWNFRSNATGDLDISAINNGDCIFIKTRPGESIQTNANLVFNDKYNFAANAWWELQGNDTNFLLYPKHTPLTQFVDISAKTIIEGQQQKDLSDNLLDLRFYGPSGNYANLGPDNPIIKKAVNIILDCSGTTSGAGPNSTILAYGIDISSYSTDHGLKYNYGINVDVGGADFNFPAIFNGGNVGIGTLTTDPSATLDVSGNMMLHADNSASYLNFGLTSGEAGYGLRNNDGTIQFKDSNFLKWEDLCGGGGTTNWSKDAGDNSLYYLGGNVGIGHDPGPENPTANIPRLLDICGSLINGYDCSALPANYSHAEGEGCSAIGIASHAEGYYCSALDFFSHAEGSGNIASGIGSHAEGESCQTENGALGSHAEGLRGYATGRYSHVEGIDCSTIGHYTHVEGSGNIADGLAAHAEGTGTTASGIASHAEGGFTLTGTDGLAAHAEGGFTRALHVGSHAEGYYTCASGAYAHAEGHDCSAQSYYSHAEGYNTTAFNLYAHAEGYSTIASGYASHVEGSANIVSGIASHAEGELNTVKASSFASHAEGQYCDVSGYGSHVEGFYTKVTNDRAHAEGSHTHASGYSSHAEGNLTRATYNYCHAEGGNTTATGEGAHAEGYDCSANGNYSHVEGSGNLVTGRSAHAEGYLNIVDGDYSHAEGGNNVVYGIKQHAEGCCNTITSNAHYAHVEGYENTAYGKWMHVSGRYNVEDAEDAAAAMDFSCVDTSAVFVVGCGTSGDRKDAFTITSDCSAYFGGSLWARSCIIVPEDTTAYFPLPTNDYYLPNKGNVKVIIPSKQTIGYVRNNAKIIMPDATSDNVGMEISLIINTDISTNFVFGVKGTVPMSTSLIYGYLSYMHGGGGLVNQDMSMTSMQGRCEPVFNYACGQEGFRYLHFNQTPDEIAEDVSKSFFGTNITFTYVKTNEIAMSGTLVSTGLKPVSFFNGLPL